MSESIVSQGKLRRILSPSEKLAIVQASYHPGVLVAEVARKYNVGVSSLIKWRSGNWRPRANMCFSRARIHCGFRMVLGLLD